MDDIDRNILKTLQEHARVTNMDLAERVGLSAAPCLRRVRALEERGVIVAAREGAVRFSPHAYNDRGEVERILETTDGIGRS